MVVNHILGLDIPETNNPYIFPVKDASLYVDGFVVSGGQLAVTLPGFTTPIPFNVQTGFNSQLSACDLGIQSIGCGSIFNSLPDGIYVVRYSVSPNDQIYVEYNYLRMTNTLNSYYTELSNLEMAMSDPDVQMQDTLKELRLIKTFLDIAKAKVEIAHLNADGIDLFNYAAKRLKKLIQTCQ